MLKFLALTLLALAGARAPPSIDEKRTALLARRAALKSGELAGPALTMLRRAKRTNARLKAKAAAERRLQAPDAPAMPDCDGGEQCELLVSTYLECQREIEAYAECEGVDDGIDDDVTDDGAGVTPAPSQSVDGLCQEVETSWALFCVLGSFLGDCGDLFVDFATCLYSGLCDESYSCADVDTDPPGDDDIFGYLFDDDFDAEDDDEGGEDDKGSSGDAANEFFCEQQGFDEEACKAQECCIWDEDDGPGKCWYDGGMCPASADSQSWHKKNSPEKDCAFVSEDPAARCTLKGEGSVWAFEACQSTCGAADAECVDDEGWHKEGDASKTKTCKWASRFINRCAVDGIFGQKGYEACKLSCKTCNPSIYFPSEPCGDDENWFKKNEPSKGCAWVAASPDARCTTKDANAIWAFERCKAACGGCGNCLDDVTWHKAGDVSKDCRWAKAFPNRCQAEDADGVKGYQKCPRACNTCRESPASED